MDFVEFSTHEHKIFSFKCQTFWQNWRIKAVRNENLYTHTLFDEQIRQQKKRQPSKQCACEEWILYIEKPNNKPANSAKKKINNQQPSSLDFSLDTHSLGNQMIEAYTKNPINFEWDCFCVRCQFQN